MATTSERTTSPSRTGADPVFSALVGLTSLGILLQSVWAGLFLRYDKREGTWLDVHSTGAHITTGLAVLTAVYAIVRLRARKDLLVGSIALAVLVVVESYLGGRIVDHGQDSLTAVHVPLAMALLALAVWLPLRARAGRGTHAL